MNERVLLKSGTGLVNRFGNILGFFIVLNFCIGCSPAEVSGPASADTQTEGATATVIWESEILEHETAHLAVVQEPPYSAYVLTASAEGQVRLIDMDGAVIAQGKLDKPLFSLANGFTTILEDEPFLAFPALDETGRGRFILASTALGVIGEAELDLGEEQIVRFCSTASGGPDYTVIDSGRSVRPAEVAVVNNRAYLQTDNYDAESDVSCKESSDVPVVLTSTIEQVISLNDNSISVIVPGDDTPSPVAIKGGMSTKAPTEINAFAALQGRISVDYPEGLLVIAGTSQDRGHRISFLRVDDLVDTNEDIQDTEGTSE